MLWVLKKSRCNETVLLSSQNMLKLMGKKVLTIYLRSILICTNNIPPTYNPNVILWGIGKQTQKAQQAYTLMMGLSAKLVTRDKQ